MKNNERYERVRNAFDEIIKESAALYMESEDDTPVLSDDEMREKGYSLPPEDMYKRIMSACKDSAAREKPVRVKKTWKKVLLIAAIISALLAISLCVGAVKNFVFNTINQITSDTIKIKRGNETDLERDDANNGEAFHNAENQLGIKLQKPNYMPDNMILDKIQIYSNKQIRADYKDGNDIIKIDITLIDENEASGMTIHTENGEASDKAIGDKQVRLYYYTRDNAEDWTTAEWNDGTALYEISSNIDRAVLEEIIKEFHY